LVSLTVKSGRFSLRAALFIEMAALIRSGYRGYIYIVHEFAGKKVKYTLPGGGGRQIEANKAHLITENSCVLHLQSNTTIFHLVVH